MTLISLTFVWAKENRLDKDQLQYATSSVSNHNNRGVFDTISEVYASNIIMEHLSLLTHCDSAEQTNVKLSQ